MIVTSGGIGANHELVRKNWPARLGEAPENMICGVPDHVDGRMLAISAGGRARSIINPDRMWHYVEGIRNWDPIWSRHGIRILPGPSPLWLDATGKRLPVPLFPGFDTLGTLEHIMQTGHDYTWFVLTQKMIEKEFALSGSEQNPDLTSKSVIEVLKSRVGQGRARPGRGVQAERRRLRRRARPRRARARDERADRASRCSSSPTSSARSSRATARSRTPTRRTSRSRRSAARAATCPTGSRASPPPTGSSTRRPAR